MKASKRIHFIAMDTHGKSTDICCKTSVKSPARRWHVATTIPSLREVIESIPRPRQVVFEEGPLADWLYRELKPFADEMVVCDPRRNGLIAKDGDKDDPIDSQKLCDLQIGGYIRSVHHSDSLERVIFKRQVGLYHERVEHRVSECNKIIGMLKGWGLVVLEKDFEGKERRQELLERLVRHGGNKLVGEHVRMLWKGYDLAMQQEEQLRRDLKREAKKDSDRRELIGRLVELPGVALVRACTFVAYLDTPWRFKSKQALWKYMGIGLVRESSGQSREYVHVELACNRRLKCAMIGAAKSAMLSREDKNGKTNPFAWQYRQWLERGISPRNARRNVARSMAAVMWGMWKNGGVYEPDRVGLSQQCISSNA